MPQREDVDMKLEVCNRRCNPSKLFHLQSKAPVALPQKKKKTNDEDLIQRARPPLPAVFSSSVHTMKTTLVAALASLMLMRMMFTSNNLPNRDTF